MGPRLRGDDPNDQSNHRPVRASEFRRVGKGAAAAAPVRPMTLHRAVPTRIYFRGRPRGLRRAPQWTTERSAQAPQPTLRSVRGHHRPVLASEWTQPTMRDLAFSMSFLEKKSSGLTLSTG